MSKPAPPPITTASPEAELRDKTRMLDRYIANRHEGRLAGGALKEIATARVTE